MKKSILPILLFSLCACSNNNEELSNVDKQSSFTINLALDKSISTKAAQSTAIPETSWADIEQVQLFLYDASNTVKFSEIITPSAGSTSFTYNNVPVGNYTIVAVANAKSSTQPITTSIDGGTSFTEWDKFNVRAKDVNRMQIDFKDGSFPAFATDLTGKKAYAEPAQIFMGSVSNVTVTEAVVTVAPTIELKREVSLMRVRLNVKDGVASGGLAKLDFTQNASVMIHRLPEYIKINSGNTGGVHNVSEVNDILSIHGNNLFNTTDPTSGYNPTTILSGNFTMWKDIVVFPNNGGRINNANTTATADANKQYFIVISALGKAGHIMADGTILTADQTIYWSGLIKEVFTPNVIREVNLTLRSGGSTSEPVDPTEEGGLTIQVSAPSAWDSNIVESNIIM
ncbi:MAG: FimB/Mfa2 family fimbrial subunit [Bacteroidales bacterium]